MQLQLARHGTDKKPKKREKEIIAEHRLRWLGEIAAVLAASDDVFQNGFLWQAATGDLEDERKPAGYRILITGAGTQLEWSTVERLTTWRHFDGGTYGLLGGKRLYNLRELTDIGGNDLASLAYGSERPLEVLELGRPRTYNGWASLDYHTKLGDAFDRLPNLREVRFGAMRSSIETVADLARRAKALRALTIGVATQKQLPDMIAMAQALGLESIGTLAVHHDFYYELASRTLRIEYPQKLHDNIAIAGSKRVRSLTSPSPLRVVIRAPTRAKTAAPGDDPTRAPVLTRNTERMDLAPIWEAAASVGATCSLEPHVPHWSRSPVRDE